MICCHRTSWNIHGNQSPNCCPFLTNPFSSTQARLCNNQHMPSCFQTVVPEMLYLHNFHRVPTEKIVAASCQMAIPPPSPRILGTVVGTPPFPRLCSYRRSRAIFKNLGTKRIVAAVGKNICPSPVYPNLSSRCGQSVGISKNCHAIPNPHFASIDSHVRRYTRKKLCFFQICMHHTGGYRCRVYLFPKPLNRNIAKTMKCEFRTKIIQFS